MIGAQFDCYGLLGLVCGLFAGEELPELSTEEGATAAAGAADRDDEDALEEE